MKIKAGTKIEIRGFDLANRMVWRPAVIARTMKYMLPMPAGYHPVKYEDGAVLLVHEKGFRLAA